MDATRTQRRVLTVVALSTVLVLLAFVTPLATAVRTAAGLAAGAAGLTWTLSGMSVGLAVSLLIAGVLADDRGRRRVFTLGLVVLGIASAAAAAAGHVGVVIAARLVEGVGGAAVLAGGLGMIGQAYGSGPGRARATAIWGAAVGAGTGLGGIAAVVLDHADGSWRVTYVVTAALAFVLAAFGMRLLPESAATRSRPVDVAGVLLLGGGLGALLAGLLEGRTGWSAGPVGLVVGGAALLAGFVAVQARRTAPLIDLTLFRVRGFTAATVGALIAGAGIIGVASYVPTVLQRGLGASLPSVMVLMLIWSAIGTATSWLLRGAHAVSGRVLLTGALGVSAAGLAGLVVLEPGASEWWLLPGLAVLGVGYGAANAALGRESIAHLPAAQAGMGSGTNNTARYVGSALGVTVTAVLAVPSAPPAALLRGFDAAALGGAALSLAGAVLIAWLGRPGPAASRGAVDDEPAAVVLGDPVG
jgi:MFS family permease